MVSGSATGVGIFDCTSSSSFFFLADTIARLSQAFMVGNGLPIRFPPNLKTPPYVTAQPVVTHRKIKFDDEKNPTIKFIVLATDGLWDELRFVRSC
jgi:serine/threonine protein phosphatase PrpC